MADVVGAIREAIEARVVAVTSFQKIRNVREPEKNDERNLKRGFAVTSEGGVFAEGVVTAYTIDQQFNILLTSFVANRNSDAAIQAETGVLFDFGDLLIKDIFTTKIGLPLIVLIVQNPDYAPPEIMENGGILLILSFTVKYRQNIK